MNKWLRKFDEAMSAAAFAEEGEFDTARKILREQKTVVVALTGESAETNAFRYAMSVCQRLDAKLDILYPANDDSSLLKQFKPELTQQGIDYSFIKTDGCVKEAVLEHTSNRRDILFVVMESWDGYDAKCRKSTRLVNRSWINLKCPLVVVSDLAKA
jgi:hypothetical protein